MKKTSPLRQTRTFWSRSPATVRKSDVPQCWRSFMDDFQFEGLISSNALQVGEVYDLRLDEDWRFRIVFGENLKTCRVQIVNVFQANSIDDFKKEVVMADDFLSGNSSFLIHAIYVLSLVILIEDLDSDLVNDLLNIPSVNQVNTFIRGPANICPPVSVGRLFSVGKKQLPRFVSSSLKGESSTSDSNLSVLLLCKQSLYLATGDRPKSLHDMTCVNLSSLSNPLVNALMGIIYAIIMDKQLMHASIGAHLRVEGGPKPTKV